MIRPPATGPEWAAVGTLVGAGVVFVGIGVPRLVAGGGLEVLTLPLALLAADVLIGAALLTGWYPIRPVAQGLAIFGMLVHVLVLLRNGPVWVRGCSAILVGAHGWAQVLLFAMTADEDRDELDDYDELEETEPEEASEPDEVPEPAELSVPDEVRESDELAVPDDAPEPVRASEAADASEPDQAAELDGARQPAGAGAPGQPVDVVAETPVTEVTDLVRIPDEERTT